MTDKLEILNTRLIAARRQDVFDAFAEPPQLEQWWGPDGFTNKVPHSDLRPGGQWRIIMTASNGTDFDNLCTFEEVVMPERVSYIHHEPMHVFHMSMVFEEEAGGTRLTWRMLFDRTEENLELEKFLAAANEQNFDRLERHLQQTGKILS
ncbi:SRPBCC domain-containing protein [Rhizobium sp. RU36D]|uniref:SRPBCC domain-containing protein n=1 Tax=Rhizobium sp. RU36D TaxID=1907415 RepID=UPI0009D8BBF7|nr:SRPBCC domain-containing protein [Rhizobium sp. RU36D]SMC60796.1 Activator of Hsp90 ATPase homolog 1-like protein [Rhizobium sp. RU36D]